GVTILTGEPVIEPWSEELVVPRGRPEVPQHRVTTARQQGEPDHLVHGPGADVGRGHVPDVVEVERQQGAEVGLLQLDLQAIETLSTQPSHVEAVLPVDTVSAEGGG